jgi:hypothetical protein
MHHFVSFAHPVQPTRCSGSVRCDGVAGVTCPDTRSPASQIIGRSLSSSLVCQNLDLPSLFVLPPTLLPARIVVNVARHYFARRVAFSFCTVPMWGPRLFNNTSWVKKRGSRDRCTTNESVFARSHHESAKFLTMWVLDSPSRTARCWLTRPLTSPGGGATAGKFISFPFSIPTMSLSCS